MSRLTQFVLVRGDLMGEMEWPLSRVIAQACHASTASLHLFREDEKTIKYLEDLDNMHKIILEVPTGGMLKKLTIKLQRARIMHKVWIHQPDNIPTCVALKPYCKEDVNKYLTKYKLFNATEILKS